MKKSWTEYNEKTGLSKEDWISHCFFDKGEKEGIKSNLVAFSKTFEDVSEFNKLSFRLVEFLKANMRELENNFSYYEKTKELKGNFVEFFNEDSYAILDLTGKRIKKVSFSIRSFNLGLIEKVKLIFDEFESKFEFDESLDQDSEIFVMTSGQSGIEFTNTGRPENALVRQNYSKDVLESYDYIAEQLQDKKPDGRLVIFHGVPGSGKTYLLEGLMHEIKNCVFILVPSDYLSSLNNPSFLPALIGLKEEIGFENDIAENGEENIFDISINSNEIEEWNEILLENRTDRPSNSLLRKHGSLILIVEDADSNLEKRDGTNSNIISSVLNFADGILGRTLDLRIVCTTNLKDMKLDDAIQRPGRLLKKVHVDALSGDEAIACYRGILEMKEDQEIPSDDLNYLKKGMTVAEIYKLAYNKRDAEKVLKKSEPKKSFGF